MQATPAQNLAHTATAFTPSHRIDDIKWYEFCQKTYYLLILHDQAYAKCRYAPHPVLDDIYAWHMGDHWVYVSSGMRLLQTMSGLYTHIQDPHHGIMLDMMRQRLNHKRLLPNTIHACQAVDDDAMGHLPAFHLYAPAYGVDNYIWADKADFYLLLRDCLTEPERRIDMGQIVLKPQMLLGSSTLDYATYQRLSTGDIVLIQTPRFDLDGNGVKPMGDMAMRMRYDDALYFTSWEHNTMPNDDDSHYQDDDQRDNKNDNENAEEDESTHQDENEDKDEDYNQEEYTDSAHADEDTQEDDPHADHEVISDDDAPKFAPPAQEDKHPFSDISVQLDFSLGTVAMTVAQVSELSENAILPLNAPMHGQAQVAIYANKKLIAHGEMVAIGQQLGVRITHIQS